MTAAAKVPDPGLPEAEATLVALAERMRGAVAHDAAFVGIYSGGAWIAERLPALVPGDHLLVGLGAAELVHELVRVGPPQQVEIVVRPRAEFDVGHATIESRPKRSGNREARTAATLRVEERTTAGRGAPRRFSRPGKASRRPLRDLLY